MNKHFYVSIFSLTAIFGILALGCENKNVEEEFPEPSCKSETEQFDTLFLTSVKPILEAECYECHKGARIEAGIDYSDYCETVTSALSGNLLGSINHDSKYKPMPNDLTKLSQADIDKIEAWVLFIKDSTISTCGPGESCLTNTVKPILDAYGCFACHGTSTQFGGYNFTNYNSLKSVADNGELKGAINHLSGFRPMPDGGGKMSDSDIAKVEEWIALGALDN